MNVSLGRVGALFAVALGAAGCPLIYHAQLPTHARPLHPIQGRVELVTNPDANGTPFLCIEVPIGWPITSVTFTGTVGGALVSGTGRYDEPTSNQVRGSEARPNATWFCYLGPAQFYDTRARGKVNVGIDVPSAFGPFDVRFAAGDVMSPVSRAILTRRIVVLERDDHLDAWTGQTYAFQFGEGLHEVAHGNGRWVAVGRNELAIYSVDDGYHWRAASTGTVEQLEGLAFGNGLFVAAGASETVLTSSTGERWLPVYSSPGTTAFDVVFGGGLFVIPHASGGVLTSPDAMMWSDQSTPAGVDLYGAAYGGARFVAVGAGGTIVYSDDGLAWNLATSTTTEDLQSVAYGSGLFVAVGAAGTVLSSFDGERWDRAESGTVELLADVTYGNGLFIAVSRDGQGTILTSPDGALWTRHEAGTNLPLFSVAFAEDTYLVTGETGLVLRSGVPRASISGALDFGTVDPGQSSQAQFFDVVSGGKSPLTVGTMRVVGTNMDQFRLVDPTACDSSVVASGCTAVIEFRPTSPGAKTASVAVETNDPQHPLLTVVLTGIGAATPDIAVTDASGAPDDLTLGFPDVPSGMVVMATVTVENHGEGPLLMGRIAGTNTLEAPLSITDDLCSNQTIAGGASCTLVVRYAPLEAGSANDAFDIPSNDLDQPSIIMTVRASAKAPPIVTCTGSPPSAPELVSPADGATDVSVPVEFGWLSSTDADGDTITYALSYCTDSTFTGCVPVTVAARGGSGVALAFAGLFAAALFLALLPRRGLAGAWIVLALGAACGSDSTKPPHLYSGDAAGGMKYSWKVSARDSKGCTTESAVRSFTTAQR